MHTMMLGTAPRAPAHRRSCVCQRTISQLARCKHEALCLGVCNGTMAHLTTSLCSVKHIPMEAVTLIMSCKDVVQTGHGYPLVLGNRHLYTKHPNASLVSKMSHCTARSQSCPADLQMHGFYCAGLSLALSTLTCMAAIVRVSVLPVDPQSHSCYCADLSLALPTLNCTAHHVFLHGHIYPSKAHIY